MLAAFLERGPRRLLAEKDVLLLDRERLPIAGVRGQDDERQLQRAYLALKLRAVVRLHLGRRVEAPRLLGTTIVDRRLGLEPCLLVCDRDDVERPFNRRIRTVEDEPRRSRRQQRDDDGPLTNTCRRRVVAAEMSHGLTFRSCLWSRSTWPPRSRSLAAESGGEVAPRAKLSRICSSDACSCCAGFPCARFVRFSNALAGFVTSSASASTRTPPATSSSV